MMNDKPIRYGIVGLGRAGWDIHVAALRPREDATIVAVVDQLEQRREEAKAEFGCATYDNFDDMLADDNVDVVVVATPSMAHKSNTIAALNAGKHVACEKPMALNLADADEMIAVAEQTGRQLFIHQNYRFRPEFQYLLHQVLSGRIGKLYHVRCHITNFTRRNDWQTLSKNGGGVLNNTCPHFLDMILQLMGAPVTRVMGDMQQIASAGDVEDHVKIFLRADNGVTSDIEISSAQKIEGDLPRWVLCGTWGTLTSDGDNATIHYFDPNNAPPQEVVDGPVMSRDYDFGDQLSWQQVTETATKDAPPFGNFYDNIAAVLHRGEPMYVTSQSVREVLRVMGEIRKGTAFEYNQ
jgi:predicted dehydrogenase